MRLVGWIGTGSLIAAFACGGGSANTETNTATNSANTQTTDDAALNADLMEHHAHHHGGFTHLVIMSVETVGGTPEQKDKIEAIRKDLLAKTAPVHAANTNLITVLADTLADGTASPEEQAKVDAAVQQLATASSSAHTAAAQAMNQLHAVLDAAQRQTLVDKVQAQWEVWRSANAADDKDNNGLSDADERRLEALTKKFALAADQVDKMKAALKTAMVNAPKLDPAEVDAHIKKWGEAFVTDGFDSTKMGGEEVNAHLAGAGAGRMARFYVTIAPILTADQRTKLADHFRKHENKGPDLPSSN
jgi:Spy/CpxP family protein refolding chaperone